MDLWPVMCLDVCATLGLQDAFRTMFTIMSAFLILQMTNAHHFIASLLPRPHSTEATENLSGGAYAAKAPRGNAVKEVQCQYPPGQMKTRCRDRKEREKL